MKETNEMNVIQKDVADFHRAMVAAQRDLDDFTDSLNTRIAGVERELDALPRQARDLKMSETEPAARLINGEVDGWTRSLEACARAARETIAGHAFQHRFQKQPLVVVFGPVKAGKSTLGNFMLGKSFRKAAFDNPYRSGEIPKPSIVVEESGRTDVDTKEWFDVNSIESTCSAQYFSVPGLVWVDTPGYGAVEKKGIDIRPLAEIARQYVGYADLVIFLDNSDAVWQREVEAAFRAVYQSGKKVLSAILRSDATGDEDVVDGEIVTPLLPKDDRDRNDQERYVREGMKACGAKPADCDVVSVSVKLAEAAIAEADGAKWEASGMGAFYRKIAAALADGQVRELKKAAPRQLLSNAVKNIGENFAALGRGLSSVRRKLSEQHEALSPEGALVDEVVDEATDHLRSSVRRMVDQAIAEAESNGADELSVSLAQLQSESGRAVNEVLARAVRRLVGDYRRTTSAIFGLSGDKTKLTRSLENITYTIEVPDWKPRDPDGIWEHICAFFGKCYYRATTRSEKRTQKIDLGFDGASARKWLIGAFAEQARDYIRSELESIRRDLFGVSTRKIDTLLARLKEAEKRVNDCL